MSDKIYLEALDSLREENNNLVEENRALKMFLTSISNEITKFLTKGNRL